MTDPSLIRADYDSLLAEIKARLRRFVPQPVAQLEGDTVVPQATAAALCVLSEPVCVRVSEDQDVETRSILGP